MGESFVPHFGQYAVPAFALPHEGQYWGVSVGEFGKGSSGSDFFKDILGSSD
ncbi:hypothetical protein UF75_1887 [Desulfosporosinus sp. I2]|uniref:hypothetical protein n=1 Tax=Desulfosporosinus sp. I2 TaxID=1617025 RepID=UPI0006201E6F|nr:hypothetical protein [Desulfosporosinus sp. I2]KJR47687.1 hypothetical protein UF75_1887 [Desulfosporosinus sp. I2]